MAERFTFNSRAALANALAQSVAESLARAIATRGEGALAVSGGKTPSAFFERLAAHDEIDWAKVTITLVDERWVDESSDRSNARLVKQHLLQGPAAAARFVPLYAGGTDPGPEEIAKTNAAQQAVPQPFDAVILGMGNDGHTASFFPGGDTLATALADPGPALALHAEGAGEPRVTLTLPALLQTRTLYLHIEGPQKAETLEKALEDGPVSDMPIRAVLHQTEVPLHIYWCP